MIKVPIKLDHHNYNIFIKENIFNEVVALHIKKYAGCKAYIITDNNVRKLYLKKLKQAFIRHKVNTFSVTVPAGEKSKSFAAIERLSNRILASGINRNDIIYSLGGGVIGDLAGFLSSILLRGVRFIQIPTTLLSQVDSSVGGKTGINTVYGKNLVGSFYQPNLVLIDIFFLRTLPKREITCGYAEILKHSLISNKKFFHFLDKNVQNILKLKSPFIEKTIFESCKIKKDIVQKDEKEDNFRKILNFGHTFAHAYEASMTYSKKLNHGEAVILGIYSSLKFSLENKLTNLSDFNLILKHLNKAKLSYNINKYFSKIDTKKIVSYMRNDKKNNSEKINLVLLRKIGSMELKKKFSEKKIRSFLDEKLID